MPKFILSIAIAAAVWIGLAAEPAGAASQVLGLVASNGLATPLHCQDGTCTGHFSAFCLQEQRPAPSADSASRVAAGRVFRLPPNDLLPLRPRIGFTSVRMSLPEAKLKSLGAVSVAVEVA